MNFSFFELIIHSAYSLWIQLWFREFTVYSLCFPRNYYKLTLYFASLMNKGQSTVKKSISQIYLEFTICFAYLLWTHYFYCELIMNSLFCSRNQYESTIFFTSSETRIQIRKISLKSFKLCVYIVIFGQSQFNAKKLTLTTARFNSSWKSLTSDDFLWLDLTSNNFDF